MKIVIPLLLIVLASFHQAYGAEFRPLHCFGTASADHTAAWNGHIDHVSWLDEETILYWSNSGTLICLNLKAQKPLWSMKGLYHLSDWSLSRKQRKLLFKYKTVDDMHSEDDRVMVVDCTNGKPVLSADYDQLAKLLRLDFVVPTKIVLMPNDARLIVCNYAGNFGRNAYVLDPTYTKVDSTFEIDPFPREITFSADDRRASYIAKNKVLCIRDIVKNEEVYFSGERILKEPDSMTFSIGEPFLSHIRHDGNDMLIYSVDGGCWGRGVMHVENLEAKIKKTFDGRHGHIVFDVDFERKRIALTGTETDLTVLKFDGEVVADLPKATLQRNCAVEFSPSGKRIAVGSWDNTVRIFAIVE